MVCGDDSRGFMMEKAMVYVLVCQAKQEIMRNRNKFSPKSPENREPGPLSEPHLDVEETFAPQATGSHSVSRLSPGHGRRAWGLVTMAALPRPTPFLASSDCHRFSQLLTLVNMLDFVFWFFPWRVALLDVGSRSLILTCLTSKTK